MKVFDYSSTKYIDFFLFILNSNLNIYLPFIHFQMFQMFVSQHNGTAGGYNVTQAFQQIILSVSGICFCHILTGAFQKSSIHSQQFVLQLFNEIKTQEKYLYFNI